MTTFVALGDSFTLGIGDPVCRPGGWDWRGWAALLAEGHERGHADTPTGLAVWSTAS